MTTHTAPKIYFESGGKGDTTYLLLHGLGATGAVWQGVADIIEEKKLGRWVAPDLRGHGRSDWAETYGLGEHSNDIAELVRGHNKIIIAGHSMGGLIGLSMATSWFGLNVVGILVIGTMIKWNDGDSERFNALAEKPIRWFGEKDEAVERYLKVSGLYDTVAADHPMVASGIKEEGGKFRLAADNATGTIGGPWMTMLMSVAECPIILAAGEHDTIVTAELYQTYDKDAVSIPNVAHNAHVEDPAAVWALVEKLEAKI